MGFVAALRFLTSLPLPGGANTTAEQLGKATAWFPAAGLVIGLVLAGLNWLLGYVLPQMAVNALLLLALALLTGALHLDGLSDTCDGLAVNRSPEERREVMRDSRAGAVGIVGIVIVLLAKYAALGGVPNDWMTAVLVFMPMASRWTMVYTIFTYRYARQEGLGSAFKNATRWPQLVTATLLTLVIAAALYPLFGWAGFAMMGGALVITALLAPYLKRKFAGLTGDSYGAVNETAELACLLVAAALAYTGTI